MKSLTEQMIDALRSGQSLDGPLRELVVETKSRAAGCWRLHDEHLELLGFGAAADMDDEVDRGFREATRRVPLNRLGLGIVKAAVTGQPAIGRRDPADNSLDGSATWIARFQAQTSLAVPIHCEKSNEIVGVLAVSTAALVHPEHPLWSLLVELASQLGAAMAMPRVS
ncbi:MAG: GAF domain-containing protein [Candidatus Saccharimonas sp.]|nr:GAF domain-containing protein [Planctomycetaceae bacterium]